MKSGRMHTTLSLFSVRGREALLRVSVLGIMLPASVAGTVRYKER